jgi:hypothetical protein
MNRNRVFMISDDSYCFRIFIIHHLVMFIVLCHRLSCFTFLRHCPVWCTNPVCLLIQAGSELDD